MLNMESEIYVSCHAPSLSLLLFETVRSSHDQKGLLIGEVCKEIIAEKTDENEMNSEHRTTIYLEHCVPIKDNDFFGNVGNVNKQKLLKYVDQYYHKIIGWYSFRRNTRVSSRTLQEIITHQSLLKSIPNVKPELFIAAFMSASVGANFSTHTYNHLFTRFHPTSARFEPLKFKIYTMSDKITSSNGYSVKNSFPSSRNFDKIINSTQKEESPIMSVLAINKSINEILKITNTKLQDMDSCKNQLELQIKTLRRRLSLDNLNDIMVKEEVNEYKTLKPQFLYFDSNINYNLNRKENLIKVVPAEIPSLVPQDRTNEVSNIKQ